MSEFVQVTTLPNGLRVVSDPIAGSETVSMGVWTNCGSRHETAPINGVAHMLEHMLFKGTARRSARDIAEEMEAVGGHLNAYTGRENTAYYARVLKNDAGLALDILGDLLQHSQFAEDELTRERHVVLQEIGQTMDTPDDIIFDHYQHTAYPNQPVGRPILGSAETVTSLSRETLQTYIAQHYAPENLIVSASGAVEHNWLVDKTASLFNNLPSKAVSSEIKAEYRGGDMRVEDTLEQVHVVLGFAGVSLHDPDYYTAQVFSIILGGGMSSRLFQEIREKRGLVYTVQSFLTDFVDSGLFGVYAGTGDNNLQELIPVLCDELSKARNGFTDAEISRAKAQLKASMVMGLENSFSRAEHLAMNMLIYGRLIPIAETLARIDTVDAAGLTRVAKRILSSKPTLTAMGNLTHLEAYDTLAGRVAA